MKTIDIKGKQYVPVSERIKAFRAAPEYKGWSLVSELKKFSDAVCIVEAKILDDTGKVVATGLAYEKADSSFINKTSYLENCETSAWGRALGNLGIGIDESISTADEIATAMNNQHAAAPQDDKMIFRRTCTTCGKDFQTEKEWAKECYDCYKKKKNES